MKSAKFLFFTLFIISLISCSNDDSVENKVPNEPLLTEINANVYNVGLGSDRKLTFEYDSDKRLVKKNGSYIPLDPIIGFGGFFSNELHTSFTYKGNTVTIEDYSTYPDLNIPKNTRILTLNAQNQIETKEIPNVSNSIFSKKLNYIYDQNKLVKIVTTYPNRPVDAVNPIDIANYVLSYVENFYYDSKGNLTKSEYFEQRDGVNKGRKIIQIFEDYDTSENPCKKLQLVDEFFYRSLSNNNFRKCIQSHYSNEALSMESTSIWEFSYNSNGQIIIN